MIAVEAELLALRLCGQQWQWADDNRVAIDKHWQGLCAANPNVWNGRVLMATDVNAADGAFSASFIDANFASFIAWRDWGWPDKSVFNCFGSAGVVSGDGALIYGRMAPWTVSPGACYPPGGSLDRGDVHKDGSVDILGSIRRELFEETGLDANVARVEGLWAIFDGQRISLSQILKFDKDAEQLAASMRLHIAGQESSELEDVMLLRPQADFPQSMPGYAVQLAQQFFER